MRNFIKDIDKKATGEQFRFNITSVDYSIFVS